MDRPREVKGLFPALLRQVKRQAEAGSRDALQSLWFLGVALGRAASRHDGEALLDVASDPRHGMARAGAIEGLARLKTPEGLAVARALLADSDLAVVRAALRAVVRSRHAGAAESLRGLLGHPDKDIRQEALRAMRQFERASV
jgi:HEAT repeat protein